MSETQIIIFCHCPFCGLSSKTLLNLYKKYATEQSNLGKALLKVLWVDLSLAVAR